MKLLEWFLQFFQPTLKLPRRVKFLEGTQWTCPNCNALLATARVDIYSYEVASLSDWDLVVPAWGPPLKHCGENTWVQHSNGRHQIHTPTGWVG